MAGEGVRAWTGSGCVLMQRRGSRTVEFERARLLEASKSAIGPHCVPWLAVVASESARVHLVPQAHLSDALPLHEERHEEHDATPAEGEVTDPLAAALLPAALARLVDVDERWISCPRVPLRHCGS
eukprot:3242904-Prymnesium_polylepis.1